jgi:PTS system fructose-specific IIC component
MIPFVAAGGILIALGFMLSNFAFGEDGPVEIVKYGIGKEGAYDIVNNSQPADDHVLGGVDVRHRRAAFGFLVPILSGFIAFAIADRPGLVPGIVGGFIANAMSAGFLGGIVTGILGGLIARWIAGWNVPGSSGRHAGRRHPAALALHLRRALHHPARTPHRGAHEGPQRLARGHVRWQRTGPRPDPRRDDGLRPRRPGQQDGLLLRHRRSRRSGHGHGLTPVEDHGRGHGRRHGRPLAMALATTVRPASSPSRSAKRQGSLAARCLLHLRGCDPVRGRGPGGVIASSVVGSAITGALAMVFGASLRAPHGGIWVLPLIGNFAMFLVALIVGVLVMALIVVVLKSRSRSSETVVAADSLA